MPNPRDLRELVQTLLAERGWPFGASTPDLAAPNQDRSQLLFIGNWQDACPRRLLFDPELEPVDIVTWQVIRVHSEASKMVAFPSYSQLMRGLKISRGTLARALAVLRLTRWLPLCAALRDARGRFAGHVYALSDEPLPLAEILAVDAGYVAFAERAHAHRSAHVRALARSVIEAIRAAALVPEGRALEPTAVLDQVAHRLDRMLRLVGDRVQNLNSVHPVQNLNAVRSSNLLKVTTTTRNVSATPEGVPPTPPPGPDTAALVFPPALSLTDSQRRVLSLRLEPVAAHLRQGILDEAAGRILAKRKTRDPVRCEFDYVARLATKALDGQFVLTDAGERIRRQREESGQAEARLRRAKEHSEMQRLKQLEEHQARTQGVPAVRVRSANKTDTEH